MIIMKNNFISLKNKISLITGAAGFIGSEISNELCLNGSDVILIDNNKNKLLALEKKLQKIYAVNIKSLCLDLTKEASRKRIEKLIEKDFNHIDIIINSIGIVGTDKIIGWNEKFEKQSIQAWNKAIDTNLSSIFFLIQTLYRFIKRSKNGSIINISSIYGTNAPDWELYKGTDMNNPAAYSVSKAGLNYMTKWLAETLAPDVRVNSISPGGIYRNQNKLFVKKYIKKTLLGRMASEKDIVGPVLFLASEMSSYITGQNIIIDGGISIK